MSQDGENSQIQEGLLYAPGIEWADGMVHGAGIAEFEDSSTEQDASWWSYHRRAGKRCPICLDPITDNSHTCIHCTHDWRRILDSPAELAKWIVDAAQEPALRSTVVWRKRNNSAYDHKLMQA